MIRIPESHDWTVDYNPKRGVYRISYFQDNHFVDECLFDAYKNRKVKDKAFGGA